MGARPLRRAIQRHVEDLLAEEVLSGRFPAGQHGHGRPRGRRSQLTVIEAEAPAEPPRRSSPPRERPPRTRPPARARRNPRAGDCARARAPGTVYRCRDCGSRPPLAGALPGLRGVEHRRPRRPPRPTRQRAAHGPACRRSPALADLTDVDAGPAAHGHRRVRPRAGRRAGARLPGAGGRRARHRQEHPAAAGAADMAEPGRGALLVSGEESPARCALRAGGSARDCGAASGARRDAAWSGGGRPGAPTARRCASSTRCRRCGRTSVDGRAGRGRPDPRGHRAAAARRQGATASPWCSSAT